MSKNTHPIQITYSWDCPYHISNYKNVVLAEPPKPDAVIDMNECHGGFPNDPVYRTKLYGNLEVKTVVLTPQEQKQ